MEIKSVSKICYMGAGYVGGTNAAITALANPGIQVAVVDIDNATIDRWNSKHLPIEEPGLDFVVCIARDGLNKRAPVEPQRAANLVFSTDCKKHISEADVVFLTVSTRTKDHGVGAGSTIDVKYLKAAVEIVAMVAKPGVIIVEKSTVPCKTAQMIGDMLHSSRPGVPFEVLSNPEFLSEGAAVMDLLCPPRVLIGSRRSASGIVAVNTLVSLYRWISPAKILRISQQSSELAKLVSNAILAQRISSINSISAICEATGADITDVSRSVGMDPRIGLSYLQSGLGFGGSCLRKDTLGLAYLAESLGLDEVASYWKSVVGINVWQVERFVKKVVHSFHGTLHGKKLAVFGFAFKENTSDARESQSVQVIRQLLRERPEDISIYDPGCDADVIRKQLLSTLGSISHIVKIHQDPYEACVKASAILLLTAWTTFRYPHSPTTDSVSATPTGDNDLLVTLPNGRIKFMLPRSTEYQEGYSNPEPDCPTGCALCINELTRKRSGSYLQTMEWESVLQHMEEPKLVFDTRQQIDAERLEKLGCKVVTLGRSGLESSPRL
ncbi:UDP-glucose 6-dehydrogenase 1 [Alternaria tenuissima]|nr:UDP-glucose 6-dehydrogenase 1 [Alternaria tenuissima]